MRRYHYKNQDGCHNCNYLFEFVEYDCDDYCYCTYDAPPRPKCGSVAMGESFSGVRSMGHSRIAGYKRAFDAWKKWSRNRGVESFGICDKWEKVPTPIKEEPVDYDEHLKKMKEDEKLIGYEEMQAYRDENDFAE